MFHYYCALLLEILATKSTKWTNPTRVEKFDKSIRSRRTRLGLKNLTSPQEVDGPYEG